MECNTKLRGRGICPPGLKPKGSDVAGRFPLFWPARSRKFNGSLGAATGLCFAWLWRLRVRLVLRCHSRLALRIPPPLPACALGSPWRPSPHAAAAADRPRSSFCASVPATTQDPPWRMKCAAPSSPPIRCTSSISTRTPSLPRSSML